MLKITQYLSIFNNFLSYL